MSECYECYLIVSSRQSWTEGTELRSRYIIKIFEFIVFIYAINKLFRSEFLNKLLLNTNIDGGEKVAKLDLSHQASEQFVKFLYGFDLDLNFDLDIVTELVFYAGVCGLDDLQKAAASAACGRIGLKVNML